MIYVIEHADPSASCAYQSVLCSQWCGIVILKSKNSDFVHVHKAFSHALPNKNQNFSQQILLRNFTLIARPCEVILISSLVQNKIKVHIMKVFLCDYVQTSGDPYTLQLHAILLHFATRTIETRSLQQFTIQTLQKCFTCLKIKHRRNRKT